MAPVCLLIFFGVSLAFLIWTPGWLPLVSWIFIYSRAPEDDNVVFSLLFGKHFCFVSFTKIMILVQSIDNSECTFFLCEKTFLSCPPTIQNESTRDLLHRKAGLSAVRDICSATDRVKSGSRAAYCRPC